MKKSITSLLILLLFGVGIIQIKAQTISASYNLFAQPAADRTVSFIVSDAGISTPILWGLDTAWAWDVNFKRGALFMGTNNVDIARVSFAPSEPLSGGTSLTTQQITDLDWRLSILDNFANINTEVVLNNDHAVVDSWYVGNAARWAQLMDQTTRRVQAAGRTVLSISPFNEPDNSSTGQGTIADFYNICGELMSNSLFDNIRISGGNTLNCDEAFTWYDYLKARLDEGNTHQLAGTFDNYASFYETVRANGDSATNDELHNVMEAMVGAEYGMQTAIWWGPAELARGEFVKASDGVRLGYAEHRANWTAASVYRAPDGKVQAFIGGSERQAVNTTYRFFSKDRAVYFDGYGPQHEYIIEQPGGTGYQVDQPNAEKVINITWGDDIQPAINGTYVLVNRNSGKVMEVVYADRNTDGANVQQNTYASQTTQQWVVTPIDSRLGGDFTYFKFQPVSKSTMALNNSGNSLWGGGGNVDQWTSDDSEAKEWYLEYAGDGWFYIHNRWNLYCLEVVNAYTTDGANIQQWDKNGATCQQWRFLPVGAPIEFSPPTAPSNLSVTANAESIQLNWTANSEADLGGYTIFRSESTGGPYNTIARDVTTTSFVDNTATTGGPYYYAIKAVDNSLNSSTYSNEVSSTATGANDLVAHIKFDGNTLDNSINGNNSVTYGAPSFVTGHVGSNAIALDGADDFVQLPANLASQQEITIATWVYWNGGSAWQRIFDFGNSQSEYIFLTPSSGTGTLRFAIKNGGVEETLDAPVLSTSVWSHVAVTLGSSGARIYVNGALVSESTSFTISPLDIKPVLNYIGRSQWPDPLFNGNIDEFQVYNYELSSAQITQVYSGDILTNVENIDCVTNMSLWPVPASDVLHVNYSTGNNNILSTLMVFDMNGSLVMSKVINANNTELNTSNLSSGVYMLKLTNSKETLMKKIIIKH